MSRRRSARPSCDRPCAGLCRAEGFAAAHRANRAWLLARARTLLGDPGAAEDAVQETFLRAWAACRTFDPSAGPTLATWLGTIGRNVAVDVLRARAVRPRLAPESDDVAEPPATADAAVAAALDIPVGTVKSRVHHALRGMRRSLDHDRTVLAA